MNDKWLELAREAKLLGGNPYYEKLIILQTERFARLIIEECTTLIKSEGPSVDTIEAHFGLKSNN